MARILLVEDDDQFRRAVKGLLEKYDHEVVEAVTVEQAVDEIDQQPFDLVVTDYALGSCRSGLFLMDHLQQSGRHVPVIVISAYDAEWLEPMAMRMGAYAFVRKPFGPRSFLEVCGSALRDMS